LAMSLSAGFRVYEDTLKQVWAWHPAWCCADRE
jgi:hypothetical protein